MCNRPTVTNEWANKTVKKTIWNEVGKWLHLAHWPP